MGWKEFWLLVGEPTCFTYQLLVFILVCRLKCPSSKVERVRWRLRVRVWTATQLTQIACPGELPHPHLNTHTGPCPSDQPKFPFCSSVTGHRAPRPSVFWLLSSVSRVSIFSDLATDLSVALLLLALSLAFWSEQTSTGCSALEDSSWTGSCWCCCPWGVGVWGFVYVQSCLSDHLNPFKVNQIRSLPSGLSYYSDPKPVTLFP